MDGGHHGDHHGGAGEGCVVLRVRALPRFTALCASECRDFVLKWSKT